VADPSYTIGNPVIGTEYGTVPVTFTIDGADYQRDVNCVFTPPGSVFHSTYDLAKTTQRVEQILMGLVNKISVGAVAPMTIDDISNTDTPTPAE